MLKRSSESQPPANALKKRIVLADGQASLRGLLRRLMNEMGCDVVAETDSGIEAVRLCRQLQPDILVLELSLREMSGPEIISQLREEHLPIRTLVFTGAKNDDLMRRALHSHPNGFVHKENSLTALQVGLRSVLHGGTYHCAVATTLREDAGKADFAGVLADCERIVLKLIAEGMSNKMMAHRLGVSVKTIEHRRADLMRKLKRHDIASLTVVAVQMGLIG